jgi:hypothetical protein
MFYLLLALSLIGLFVINILISGIVIKLFQSYLNKKKYKLTHKFNIFLVYLLIFSIGLIFGVGILYKIL